MSQSVQIEAPPKVVVHTKIAVVYFNRSVVLCGEERDSASLAIPGQAHQPGNVVDSILPVTALSDGTFDRSGKVANGLLFQKRRYDARVSGQIMARTFVPFTDVRCITYGHE